MSVNCNDFLKMAKEVFETMKQDEMHDMNQQKLVKYDFPHGLFMATKNGEEFIGVKIMVGTQKEIKEAFHESY